MDYDFTTKRLIVKEWHTFDPNELGEPDLVEIVKNMLTRDVTGNFPFMWQGEYNRRRAEAWIKERDEEAKTLLAVEKESNTAIGYISFFTVGDRSKGLNLRIGYLLSKAKWGKGLGTELLEGFVSWCHNNQVVSLTASVEPDNIGSIRVLQKNTFITQMKDGNGRALLYVYNLLK